jgi:Domain of unknown function (DUF4956)
MEPQEPGETNTRRKGQIWKLFAYFLAMYVITYAASQVFMKYKDVVEAHGLVKIGAMMTRYLDAAGKLDDTVVTVWSLVWTALLVLPIGWIYWTTKARESYDRALVKTLLILGMVVCGIMMVIQDQFSRALALIGVVSAVQFRTNLKDPNDAIYLLVSIAIGMGTGLGVLRVVTVFTIVMSLMFLVLWRFRVGEQPASDEDFVLAHKGNKKKKKKDKKGKKDRQTVAAFSEESSGVVGAAAVAAEPVAKDRE